MNTQEIADKLVAYCSEGKWKEAVAELYDPSIVSIEMPGTPFTQRTEGLEGYAAKSEQWNAMVDELHGVQVSQALVAGDHFCIRMEMDVTMKGQPRKNDPELCMYKVKDGKIVSEQFFYPTA